MITLYRVPVHSHAHRPSVPVEERLLAQRAVWVGLQVVTVVGLGVGVGRSFGYAGQVNSLTCIVPIINLLEIEDESCLV